MSNEPNPQIGALTGMRLPVVPKRYYGKYRGKVIDNIDPLFLGRVIAEVPAISEIPTTWALPCVPYAGFEVGFYAIPPIGANIWVEFEAGDPDHPIWTGCFWEEGQVPLGAPVPEMKIFKTETITLILNDLPDAGGLTLEIIPPSVDTPISVTMDSAGIQVVTEATFDLTSVDSNLTSETLTVETTETNLTSEALTIEAAETNLTGDALTIEVAETNLAGDALTIETLETNITSLALTTESVETNIASPAITIEGLAEVTGDLLIDGQQPIVL